MAPSRRELLRLALPLFGSPLILGCRRPGESRHHVLHVTVEGRRHVVRIERALRPGPLLVNEGLALRRYAGHGSVVAREAQLVLLAVTAQAEEAYFHSTPDDTWTEVGLRTETGENAWHTHGVRLLPATALVTLFCGDPRGRGRAFPRPTRVVSYHIHPVPFVRRLLARTGRPASYERLLHLPSAADLFVHARLEEAFGRRGVALASRVAVPDALIDYAVAPPLRARILGAAAPHLLRELETYEAARLSYAQNDISRPYFQEVLAEKLRQRGFAPDLIRLRVDERVPTVT